MKIKKFDYKRKDGEERPVIVMVVNESSDFYAGIDLTKLKEKESLEVQDIQKEYEEKLKPYMKAYRKFLKEGILNEDKK